MINLVVRFYRINKTEHTNSSLTEERTNFTATDYYRLSFDDYSFSSSKSNTSLTPEEEENVASDCIYENASSTWKAFI